MSEHKRFIHRTLSISVANDERSLAKALIGILTRGIHDLDGIVAALDESDLAPGSGTRRTMADAR